MVDLKSGDVKMRASEKGVKSFRVEIGKLRVISDSTRKEHNRIVSWIDAHYFTTGTTGESLAFILPTKACKYARAKHGGCSFCTLPTDNPWNPDERMIEELPERCVEIFTEKKANNPALDAVKFYTSGSFLDPWELPEQTRAGILGAFSNLVSEVIIETRCEFVIKKHIEHSLLHIDNSKLIVAIGQESTNDEINARANNKGHTYRQFSRAVNLLHSYGVKIKGYILLKPIFISELLSIFDAIQTAKDMSKLGVQYISINPCYIGKGTLMERLFLKGVYSSPWLWSILEVTKGIKSLVGEKIVVICDPVASGLDRGPRNCKICDAEFKTMLKEFSATQNIDLLNTLRCGCKTAYNSLILTEHLANGSGIVAVANH